MMLSEFVELTGFEPMPDEYEEIEQAYYAFNGDKAAFCKAFVENGDGLTIYKHRAKIIEKLEGRILELDKMSRQESEKYEARIADLEAQLDKEMEWRPSGDTGTNMSQDRYESLLASCTGQHGDPYVMSEEEARQMVAVEFGFSLEKIEIITTVHTYEVNKYRQLRKAATLTRQPLYDATDWNYIRFNVQGAGCTRMYEMVNGELETYSC